MRTASFVLALAAAANVSLQAPLLAFAGQGVQPVPYNPSQPISGGGTTAAPLQPLPTTAPPPPPGSGGGSDVIVLKGGGMLRGRIIEIIPNDHATIALATGQNAIVEWSRIDRIEQQPSAPSPPPPPGGGGVIVMPPPPPPGRAGKAWVHIESSHDLILEGRSPSSGRSWTPMCASPCDAEVPLDYTYRIAGEGVRTSHDFTIEGSPGQRVVLNVKTASKGGFVGGIVLVSISPVVILIGLVVVAVGAAENVTGDCTFTNTTASCNSSAGSGTQTAGWVTTLIGVAGAVIGGVLIGINSRTSFSEEIIAPVAPPVGSLDHPRREDAWLRAPIWHEPSNVERSIPPAQVAPLFTHSF